MDTKSQNSNMLLAFLTLTGVIAIVALVGFFMLRKGPEIIQGQAEVTEYRVSSKVPGRILEFRVKEGQSVQAGDTLAILEAPDVQAKLEQARAAEAAAGSVIEAFHRHQFRLVHLPHHAELADAVAARDCRVAHGQCWKAPHVVIAAVAFVDDTHAVRLQNPPLAEGRAARHNVRLVPLRQLHRHAQRNNAELPRVHRHGFRRAQVNPVSLRQDGQRHCAVVISNQNLHACSPFCLPFYHSTKRHCREDEHADFSFP